MTSYPGICTLLGVVVSNAFHHRLRIENGMLTPEFEKASFY